jgi:hypothetical protein
VSIFSFFSKKKSGRDLFRGGLDALRRDQWDDALKTLQRIGDNKAGMSQSDIGNFVIALSIVNAAAGYTDRAVVGLQFCRTFCAPGSTISKFIDGLMSQIQGNEPVLPSPYSVNGRTVPLHLYVAKEVLIAGVDGGSVDTNTVKDRALKGIAEGFLR